MKHLFIKFLILALLVTLPIVGAYLVNFNLGFQALLYYSFLCLLFLPYAFINNLKFRKIYWFIICLLTFSWSITEFGHYLQEKAPFNQLALKILYESNWQELIEYTLTIVPKLVIALVLIAIVVIIISIFKTKHYLHTYTKFQKIITSIILIVGSSYYLFFANDIGDKAGFFKDEYLANKALQQYYKSIVISPIEMQNKLAPYQFFKINIKEPHTYVLIIGESTSRHHFGVYNYFRNTTPHLSKRKDISFFTDVISSNTSTVECLSRCLTIKNDSTNVQDFSCPNIIDVANELGIKTFWLSNQAKDGILYNSITMGTARATKQYFTIADNENINIDAHQRFDILLLPQLQKALADTVKNKLIVLHLMGTHFQFKNRYPEKFNCFTTNDSLKKYFAFANTPEKLQTINEYDNAVLYNDFLLDTIFNTLQKTPNAQAIYFSDHGEEVYDYRNFIGHTPQGGNPWLHDVPFITYNVADTLLMNKNKPYQLNNFFYTLCSWMQIGCKNFPYQKSLFNNNYLETKRTLSNGEEYKEIRK